MKQAKKVRARFKPGDRVEAMISLRHTGLAVGRGEAGDVIEVSASGKCLVNWGGSILTGNTDVVGWVDQEFLL
jgi:hypothetical protein